MGEEAQYLSDTDEYDAWQYFQERERENGWKQAMSGSKKTQMRNRTRSRARARKRQQRHNDGEAKG